ncbi:MAG: division/cell wall cluster transcriptional repressor MraZ [Ruminiclostridium sp.]|nr:division/cell wall cluster transcriptional repressor MraZ [Ruminiclostridium sp.]
MRGEFKSTLDAKGRMNFPVKLRDELGDVFMVSKTVSEGEASLTLYTKSDWDELEKKLNELPQTKTSILRRFLLTSAFEIEPDKQGRALIPQPLREHAGLKDDIVIVGVGKRAEIWDKTTWDNMNSTINTKALVDVAMDLDL